MSNILIVGVGGAGCDMACRVHSVIGGRIVGVNTDRKALEKSSLQEKLEIGRTICRGSDAASPERGRRAAEESREELSLILTGSQFLVLLAGLGGGTGTGAAPVIAGIAKDLGIDVFAAVTMPFSVEESRRKYAETGLTVLRSTGASLFVYDHTLVMVDGGPIDLGMLQLLERANDEISEAVSRKVAMWPPLKT